MFFLRSLKEEGLRGRRMTRRKDDDEDEDPEGQKSNAEERRAG